MALHASQAAPEDVEQIFQLCSKGGNPEDLKRLLSKAGNENILNAVDEFGWTPLMMAVFWEKMNMVKEILNATTATLQSSRIKADFYKESPSGTSVMELARASHLKELQDLITGEADRLKRLNEYAQKTGFHETNLESFEFIRKDGSTNRYPMIGGIGGYFGGGIYFAASEEESNRKALYHGMGLKCRLKMGSVLHIKNTKELASFSLYYCDGNSYFTPVDIMKARLLERGYDSVWGHNDNSIVDENHRILQTGDEYVVYSADQVIIQKYYIIERIGWINGNIPYYAWRDYYEDTPLPTKTDSPPRIQRK